MLIPTAHIEFLITVDKQSTSQVPEMPDEMVDYFLNEAYGRFVKTRYAKNNIYKAGFEEIQKRTEDLKGLVVTELVTTIPVPYELDETAFPAVQAVLTDLTLPYWFYLRSRTLVTRESCSDKWKKPKLVQQDDLETVLEDPFNKPRTYRPVVYFENGNILIRTDGTFTVPSVKLTYIKEPLPVNLGTYGGAVQEFEISDHTHKEIVQLAADIAIENIESQRIQTLKQQLATIE
jgi:hypothetical protein